MRNVMKIVELMRGSIEGLRDNYIKIEVPSFLPLSIELLQDDGPYGQHPQISVAHFHIQAGDVCWDPTMSFQVINGEWHVLSYYQDLLGMQPQEAAFIDETTGKLMVRPKLIRELRSFSRTWDRSLGQQGFLEAAKQLSK